MLICYNSSLAKTQISLGRFLQPVYLYLRGGLIAPYLIGLFSILWLSIASQLIIKLIDIRAEFSVILTCGILSTNNILTFSNATYLPWSDIFILSLLFSVAAVYCFANSKFGFAIAPIFLCISLALYQAYFQVAVILLLIRTVKFIFDGNSFHDVMTKSLLALGSLLMGLALYYFVFRAILYITGIEAAETYNGLSEIGDYTKNPAFREFLTTYYRVAHAFIFPETFNSIVISAVNILTIQFSLIFIFKIARSRLLGWKNTLLLMFVIAFMPFGANVVGFIAKFEHTLMTYSFIFFYLFAIVVIEYKISDLANNSPPKNDARIRIGAIVFGTILILNNVVFSNQVYLKKELEYQATLSTMTRVIFHMESVEPYTPGVTPVAIIGNLDNSKITTSRSGFDHLSGVGLWGNYSLTYYKTYRQFFEQVMGYSVNLLPQDIANEFLKSDEVALMPAFPEKGFCMLFENVLVVKLSQ